MKYFFLSIVSALFVLMSFLPVDWVYTVYVSLIPFIIMNELLPPKKAFLYSTISGLLFYGIRFYWMMDVLYKFNGFKFLYVYLLVVLLTATFIGLFGFFVSVFKKKKYRFLYVGSTLVIIEFVRGNFPIIAFTWGRISDSLYSQPGVLKLSALGGEWLLIYFIVIINYLILYLLKQKKIIYYVLIVLIICSIYVINSLSYAPVNLTNSKMKVAIIQPNIDPWEKYHTDTSEIIYNLIKKSIDKKANYIVLPEASLIYKNPINDTTIRKYSKSATIIIGAAYYVNNNFYNSDFIMTKNYFREYRKHHLVPYVEYVPFRNIFGKVAGVPSGDTVAGTSTKVFGKSLKFGIEICFESIFPEIARNYALKGAKFIVVSTNDGWFKDTFAVQEHFRKLNIISAETGINFIQSANTGISGLINYKGICITKSKKNTKTILYTTLPDYSKITVYDIVGDWWIMILTLPVFLIEFFSLLFKNQN